MHDRRRPRMLKRLLILALLAVSTLLGGCGILAPEDPARVIVTGTVYVDDEPANGLHVSLYHLAPGCAFFCDNVVKTVTDATTAADGPYRLEAAVPEGDGGISYNWSCDTELRLIVSDNLFARESVQGCRTHSEVDFHLSSS